MFTSGLRRRNPPASPLLQGRASRLFINLLFVFLATEYSISENNHPFCSSNKGFFLNGHVLFSDNVTKVQSEVFVNWILTESTNMKTLPCRHYIWCSYYIDTEMGYDPIEWFSHFHWTYSKNGRRHRNLRLELLNYAGTQINHVWQAVL
jgi:hypothetical protein